MDPVTPGLVRRSGDHTPGGPTTHDNRETAQLGVPQQFHGHIERVHVDMENRSRGIHSTGDASSLLAGRAYDDVVPNSERPLSALPSGTARALAFVAILLTGAAGGLIGYGMADVQCTGECGTQLGVGVLLGSVAFAAGSAVVAVLVLRALGEWREIEDRR